MNSDIEVEGDYTKVRIEANGENSEEVGKITSLLRSTKAVEEGKMMDYPVFVGREEDGRIAVIYIKNEKRTI